jgi:(1->4)-alpha-D-glucan 1-alpha-D-glucosylmutase
MNTTSTHDTKRSEDVRVRINVLSEMPELWNEHFTKWSVLNSSIKKGIDGSVVPDPVMEMFLYQTLIGAWPLNQDDIHSFKERFKNYVIKAARESKIQTSWLSPNSLYESALVEFTERLFNDSGQSGFLNDFLELQRYVAFYGALNSLSQVLLKITSPGVPDIYQGTELWDFSLVDPDNRRPVEYETRQEKLRMLKKREKKDLPSLIGQLLNGWEDGQIKLFTIYKALNARKTYSDLFLGGSYTPLQVYGERKENICAFMREKGGYQAIVIAPRLYTKFVSYNQFPVGLPVWGDDCLALPIGSPRTWTNAFTDECTEVISANHSLPISQALSSFPIALLLHHP